MALLKSPTFCVLHSMRTSCLSSSSEIANRSFLKVRYKLLNIALKSRMMCFWNQPESAVGVGKKALSLGYSCLRFYQIALARLRANC